MTIHVLVRGDMLRIKVITGDRIKATGRPGVNNANAEGLLGRAVISTSVPAINVPCSSRVPASGQGVPKASDWRRSGGPLRDRRIGREMSFARTELLGGPTAPPDQLNGTSLPRRVELPWGTPRPASNGTLISRPLATKMEKVMEKKNEERHQIF